MSLESRLPGFEPARTALIALGSNLGDSGSILRSAMKQLEPLSNAPLKTSSLWWSDPVDCPPGSPKFINAAVALQTRDEETPESLLGRLRMMETEFGRRPRQIVNEPRSLDLDLIAFGNEVRATPQLTLPHPRAHLRRFVLAPLNEIAPDFVLPGQTQTIQTQLEKLAAGENVTRLI